MSGQAQQNVNVTVDSDQEILIPILMGCLFLVKHLQVVLQIMVSLHVDVFVIYLCQLLFDNTIVCSLYMDSNPGTTAIVADPIVTTSIALVHSLGFIVI
jgi:hypothetical protein